MSIDENILQRLRNIATPTLANALDDIGFNGVMNNLHPAGLGMKIVGRAVTVQEVTGPYGSFSTEEFKVGHMIDAASPGDVIVVANNGAQVLNDWRVALMDENAIKKFVENESI